jgi:hypothetical protein
MEAPATRTEKVQQQRKARTVRRNLQNTAELNKSASDFLSQTEGIESMAAAVSR